MTVMVVGISLPMIGWVAGSYIGILPPWYSGLVVPAVVFVVAIVLGVAAWISLDRMD